MMPDWICLAMEVWHQNSLGMLQYTNLLYCCHVICVTWQEWGTAKQVNQCINVITALVGTHMTIQKHPHTVHNCQDIWLQKCPTLNHHNIAMSMHDNICFIKQHSNGCGAEWSLQIWKCDSKTGQKGNVMHTYILLDWAKLWASWSIPLEGKMQHVASMTSYAQYLNHGKQRHHWICSSRRQCIYCSLG